MKYLKIFSIFIILIAFNVFAESEIMRQWNALTNYNEKTILSATSQFLTNCTQNELLQLCKETSQKIDSKEISGDYAYAIYFFMKTLSDKGKLTSDILLSVIADKAATKTWRLMAARYIAGSEQLLDLAQVDFQSVYNTFTNIINDKSEALSYRRKITIYLAAFFEERYIWIHAPEKAKKEGADYSLLTIAATGKLLEHDQYVNIYMDFVTNMLVSDNIPDELKQSTVRTVINRLTRVRGAKTPGLNKIKQTLELLVPPIPEVTIADVDAVTSNRVSNLENKIENGSDKALQLRKTQERILQQAATKDFTDSQKTYLSTLNTINKYLLENQN